MMSDVRAVLVADELRRMDELELGQMASLLPTETVGKLFGAALAIAEYRFGRDAVDKFIAVARSQKESTG